MPNHITVRMAWHDNKWNGCVCRDPKENSYCTGPHSLLSERLARDKDEKLEHKHREAKLDELPDYLPPCYWSANAFGPVSSDIQHVHPFKWLKKTIEEKLTAYSVFTWPFRLSFVRDKDERKRHGNYPPDLEETTNRYFQRLEPRKSLVFFYLNYSNPVSAEDYKYALLGCSVVSKIGGAKHYKFEDEELRKIRARDKKMKNFPTVNWARQIGHDFKHSGILLPYHEYLAHIDANPKDESFLSEMQVLIEEDSLIPCFKYVSSGVNDDQCIYLLYRLAQGLESAQKHGIVNVNKQVSRLEGLLQTAWSNRGLYPSLSKIVSIILENDDVGLSSQLVAAIRDCFPDKALVDAVFDLLGSKNVVPAQLASFRSEVRAARIWLQDKEEMVGMLKKLSLFSLTMKQIRRVLYPDEAGSYPFRRKNIKYTQLCENPYLLCEEYMPEYGEDNDPEENDPPIDVFTIDIGMFPDKRYFDERDFELQNLSATSKERIRALAVDFLRRMTHRGHSYMSLQQVYDNLSDYPLFYKETLGLSKQIFAGKSYTQYLSERLVLLERENELFLYLREIHAAEKHIENTIGALMSRKQYSMDTDWIGRYLKAEAKELAKDNKEFEQDVFLREREHLLKGALTRSFFVISGRPGSGKTHALQQVIEKLTERGEEVTLLAPTGKATLRACKESGFQDAQTIDMFLCKHDCREYVDRFEGFEELSPLQSGDRIVNLVIDECSMLSLEKLAVLLKLVETRGPNSIRRLVLVGDENQLPPIGCGRPFFDIVEYLTRTQGIDNPFMVCLQANCRQKFDEEILKYADLFVGGNRYYEEGFEELKKGGQVSEGLVVDLWSTTDELDEKIRQRLDALIAEELEGNARGDPVSDLNLLFGLYDKGFVMGKNPETLSVDRFQVITPYNSGRGGTIPLNKTIQQEYKSKYLGNPHYYEKQFVHSEKIICVRNLYRWGKLLLSNGSIGVLCIHRKGRKKDPAWYFPDRGNWALRDIDPEEYFEQAYAITIHKSQGSEFKNVFVVIPDRRGLLSRELLYTALTRSTHRMFIFLQQAEKSPLDIARSRSDLLERQTSLFGEPSEIAGKLEPLPGVFVRSKAEYILCGALMTHQEAGSLKFEYERELELDGLDWPIRPDFTVWVGDRVYYWEHLGMLDQGRYYKNWQERLSAYSRTKLTDILITTDDLQGVHQDLIDGVIRDLLQDRPGGVENKFSSHHYQL